MDAAWIALLGLFAASNLALVAIVITQRRKNNNNNKSAPQNNFGVARMEADLRVAQNAIIKLEGEIKDAAGLVMEKEFRTELQKIRDEITLLKMALAKR